ncbi:MAG: cyclic nucleotide-binding domain-containing protein [Candidatus Competibacteraceae bacterium]|nr:cyclic nucleotide-binding domain-containing protein [Candidatus Competibacteraceae bacterium]
MSQFAVVDSRSFRRRFPRLGHSLTEEEVQILLDTLVVVEAAPGQALHSQGKETDSLYCIWQGELTAAAHCRGRALSLGQLGPGRYLGVAELLVPGPAAFTIRPRTPTLLLRLDHPTLQALRHDHPRLGSELLRALFLELVERLQAFETTLVDQPLPPGEAAIARLGLTLLTSPEVR